jgi:hypothetical protein
MLVTVNDLVSKMLEIFPGAVIEEDANGEIVVYTALKADEKDKLVEVKDEDEDE